MKIITIIYILNSALLLLHEIESAYEREWEILKLPGKITGFLLLHIPVIFIIFYGLIELENLSAVGLIFGIALGIGGIVPFLIHKVLIRKENHFNLLISSIIIYLNILSGIILAYLSIDYFCR